MSGPIYEFEWDELKALSNLRKHGVSFALTRTVFNDERLVTAPDLEHSAAEERWFSIGRASNGMLLAVVYLWQEGPFSIKVRLISARKATAVETLHYYRGRLHE